MLPYRLGLRLIGVVRTATTKRFPLAYLSSRLKLRDHGDQIEQVVKGPDGQPPLLVFVLMNRKRRYFIASGSSLEAGLA
jgi:hypothetical protein